MITFENRATEYGLRLYGATSKGPIGIGLHRTAPEGDFDVDAREAGGGYHIFKTWDDVIHYVTKNYGENNLEEFRKHAEKLQKEMWCNPYVKKWKRRC